MSPAKFRSKQIKFCISHYFLQTLNFQLLFTKAALKLNEIKFPTVFALLISHETFDLLRKQTNYDPTLYQKSPSFLTPNICSLNVLMRNYSLSHPTSCPTPFRSFPSRSQIIYMTRHVPKLINFLMTC